MAIPDSLPLAKADDSTVTYVLQNRSGYESIRMDPGSTLAAPRTLAIKHTLGIKRNGQTVDRSLVQAVTRKVTTEGLVGSCTVNLTVDRDRSGVLSTAELRDAIIAILSFFRDDAGVAIPTTTFSRIDDVLLGLS